jgi:carboxypeptidase Q
MLRRTLVSLTVLFLPIALQAQTFPSDDPVIRAIWEEGTARSQVEPLAQALMDSIGPRLTATPGQEAAQEWAVRKYGEWGIQASNDQYGTWRGWERGISHIHLMEPRVRSLAGTLLAWSADTGGRELEGPVVSLPEVGSRGELDAWLRNVRGAWVLASAPQPTCRPDAYWEEYATPEGYAAMQAEREAAQAAWAGRLAGAGVTPQEIARLAEGAGAAGVITSNWSGGWGTIRIFSAPTDNIPAFALECEDYGLLHRLADRGQGPVVRAFAEARERGEVPVFNTIATIRGRELPDEYVVLSAHFDSWDGASGATDNGTGTVVMMEAMRILRAVHPTPRRTIIVGHWSGEEQGLIGSRAFAEDRPEVVQGTQIFLNQDNGTGRVSVISMMGFKDAGEHFARWLSRIPREITQHADLELPGVPAAGGSDHAAFICHGAPAFRLGSHEWDYRTYTWHTNRDTYDKIVLDEVRNNALLTAMLAYQAAEDPERVGRTQREMPVNPQTGAQASWPECPEPRRSYR